MFWESSGKEITYCQWLIVCENGHTCCDIYIEFRGKWPFIILIVLINHWLSTKMVPITIFSCNQAALRTLLSVRPSDTFWTMFLPSYQHEFSGAITIDKSDVHAKGPCQKSKVNVTEVKTNLAPIAPICMFPDCDSSLNFYQWLWNDALLFFKVIYSNIKVTQDKKLPILTQIERFRTVTPVWIDRWLWNNTQSLK